MRVVPLAIAPHSLFDVPDPTVQLDEQPKTPRRPHLKTGWWPARHGIAENLLDLTQIARAFGFGLAPETLDNAISPRGYRLLNKVPRLPPAIINRLVDHFGALQKLLGATIEDLQAVDGVGEARARSIREGLSRLAENSILDRYV